MKGDVSRFRQWRQKKGLKLREVASKVGLTEGMLSLVERGQRNLKASTRKRVVAALRVKDVDIFEAA
jgi:transcriptional regulator with XRE-family HTH domain